MGSRQSPCRWQTRPNGSCALTRGWEIEQAYNGRLIGWALTAIPQRVVLLSLLISEHVPSELCAKFNILALPKWQASTSHPNFLLQLIPCINI